MLELTYYNARKIDSLKDFFIVSFMLIDYFYNEIIHDSIKKQKKYFRN